LGNIAVLINNVANDDRHDIEAVDFEYFGWIANINPRPHAFAMQSVIGGVRTLGSGAIINLGSITLKRKNDGTIKYTEMKAAIHGMTRGMAKALGRDHIRVNTFVPG